jgi:hypothetical protein
MASLIPLAAWTRKMLDVLHCSCNVPDLFLACAILITLVMHMCVLPLSSGFLACLRAPVGPLGVNWCTAFEWGTLGNMSSANVFWDVTFCLFCQWNWFLVLFGCALCCAPSRACLYFRLILLCMYKFSANERSLVARLQARVGLFVVCWCTAFERGSVSDVSYAKVLRGVSWFSFFLKCIAARFRGFA